MPTIRPVHTAENTAARGGVLWQDLKDGALEGVKAVRKVEESAVCAARGERLERKREDQVGVYGDRGPGARGGEGGGMCKIDGFRTRQLGSAPRILM